MNAVNKGKVPCSTRIKIVTKGPIDKRVDNVRERREEIEFKSLDEQGQDVLCSNALEALG